LTFISGTGKTTSCLSIAGFLAKGGSKVLLIDFDLQASATSAIGIDKLTVKWSGSRGSIAFGHKKGMERKYL